MVRDDRIMQLLRVYAAEACLGVRIFVVRIEITLLVYQSRVTLLWTEWREVLVRCRICH